MSETSHRQSKLSPTGWDPEKVFEELWDHGGAGGCVFHCDTPRTNGLGRVPVWKVKQADPSKWILLPLPTLLIHQRYWFPIDRQTSSWCSPSGGRAHWFTATWSITGNGTSARTAVHNYLPLYGLMGTGEDYNWSIQWINKQKSPWQNAGKSSKPLATTPNPPFTVTNLYFRFGEKETIPRGVYRLIYYLWESSHTWRMPGWHAREIF